MVLFCKSVQVAPLWAVECTLHFLLSSTFTLFLQGGIILLKKLRKEYLSWNMSKGSEKTNFVSIDQHGANLWAKPTRVTFKVKQAYVTISSQRNLSSELCFNRTCFSDFWINFSIFDMSNNKTRTSFKNAVTHPSTEWEEHCLETLIFFMSNSHAHSVVVQALVAMLIVLKFNPWIEFFAELMAKINYFLHSKCRRVINIYSPLLRWQKRAYWLK